MDSKTLRKKFLDFYRSKNHAILPSSSLIPKEDPTLLFVNSGMYPLVPYLMGETHPDGNRLADSQKCIRTLDIDEVGDNRHLSLFEMLGSWSLGDYDKAQSIEWGFEFLTSKDYLNLDPNRLFVTVYRGNSSMEPDQIAIDTWRKMFARKGIEADVGLEYDFSLEHNDGTETVVNENSKHDPKYITRISKRSGKDNWWGLPYRGPCGPCTEIYYLLNHNPVDFEINLFPKMKPQEIENFLENEIVEIWNHVFMEYEGEKDQNSEPINLKPLAKKNIDTGMGFERLLAIINNLDTVQKTDVLKPISDVAIKWSK